MANVSANEMNKNRILNLIACVLNELIESSSSTSSDSEEELDILNNLVTARRRKVLRLKNYVEEVIPSWRDKQFKSYFSRPWCLLWRFEDACHYDATDTLMSHELDMLS